MSFAVPAEIGLRFAGADQPCFEWVAMSLLSIEPGHWTNAADIDFNPPIGIIPPGGVEAVVRECPLFEGEIVSALHLSGGFRAFEPGDVCTIMAGRLVLTVPPPKVDPEAAILAAEARGLMRAAVWHEEQADKFGEWRAWGGPSNATDQLRETIHAQAAAAIRAMIPGKAAP